MQREAGPRSALAMVLGPRIGKFNKDGSANAIPGHNIPFVVVGTLVLVFGWMGFNPGSTLGATDLRIGLVAVNTLLAACVGFVMAMIVTELKYGKPDISMSCNGMLAGLVAITAPCAFVAPWAAIIIGAIAGWLVVVQRRVLRPSRTSTTRAARSPCTACAAHGACSRSGCSPTAPTASVGTASVPTAPTACRDCSTATPASSARRSSHVFVGFIWAWGLGGCIFTVAKRFMQIRVSPEAEIEGLDMPEFGVLAYPDFVTHHAPPGHVDRGRELMSR